MTNWWKDLSNARKISVIYLAVVLLMVPLGVYGVYQYTQVGSQATTAPSPALSYAAKPTDTTSCLVTGCSKELCVDVKTGPVNTICLWKEEYACYQEFGQCQVQPGGGCGWTMSGNLVTCLGQETTPSSSPNILGTPIPQPSPTLTTGTGAVSPASPSSTSELVYAPPASPAAVNPNPTSVFVPKPSATPALTLLPSNTPAPYVGNFMPPVPMPTPASTSLNTPQFEFSLFGRSYSISLPTYLLTLFGN